MSDGLFSRELAPLESLMNATAVRHRVVSANLANLETPGYTRRDVVFESELAEQLRHGTPLAGALDTLRPRVVEDRLAPARPDGNNVDLDRENGELQKNKLLYDLYSRVLSMRIQQMQAAITGRS